MSSRFVNKCLLHKMLLFSRWAAYVGKQHQRIDIDINVPVRKNDFILKKLNTVKSG